MITLTKDGLVIELAEPRTYYKGTRFDANGIFRRISKDGYVFADEWFDSPDPLRHDNVCGCSEEFYGTYGYDEAATGGSFLKIGVGMLRKETDAPYDWFHRYEIADGGRIEVETDGVKAIYRHTLDGQYRYIKEIELLDGSSFVIRHSLTNCRQDKLEINSYCHNFFTFEGKPTARERQMDFPATPYGNWRENSLHGYLEGTSLHFDAELQQGETAYIGNLRLNPQPENFSMVLREGERSVEIKSDRPLDHMVMWACRRVACPEPYIHLVAEPGNEIRWKLGYRLK
ncbi:MAG: hypothetical protein MJZ07_03830 [Bacteroidales bacterium]|nr:hypothetical protein [Bacteroidales bacterium]